MAGGRRNRGAGLLLRYGFHGTPFGRALFAAAPRGLCHLSFTRPRAEALEELRKKWPQAVLREDRRGAAALAAAAFSGRRTPPLVLAGTPFQLKVWKTLLRVPRGQTLGYAALAKAAGVPGAARAVGAAVGANTLACLVPCHRVLRGTGELGGYRWGPALKRALLAAEA